MTTAAIVSTATFRRESRTSSSRSLTRHRLLPHPPFHPWGSTHPGGPPFPFGQLQTASSRFQPPPSSPSPYPWPFEHVLCVPTTCRPLASTDALRCGTGKDDINILPFVCGQCLTLPSMTSYLFFASSNELRTLVYVLSILLWLARALASSLMPCL